MFVGTAAVGTAAASHQTQCYDLKLQQHWCMLLKAGFGWIAKDKGCSTKWRAVCTWIVVCSAWPTARCHRSVTRTTTALRTSCVSSTHTTLHSSPAHPTWSPTTPGPGEVPTSATSSKRHGMPVCCNVGAAALPNESTLSYLALGTIHCMFALFFWTYNPLTLLTFSCVFSIFVTVCVLVITMKKQQARCWKVNTCNVYRYLLTQLFIYLID